MPGRAHGHAGHAQASGRGLQREQALDVVGRNVALERVAGDHAGMAAAELVRDAVALANGAGVRRLVHLDREAGSLEMVDPGAAAAAVRVLVYLDLRQRRLASEGQRAQRPRQPRPAKEEFFASFDDYLSNHAGLEMAGDEAGKLELAGLGELPDDFAGRRLA